MRTTQSDRSHPNQGKITDMADCSFQLYAIASGLMNELKSVYKQLRIPMAVTHIELEDIPNFLACLPDESWLEKFTTEDQIKLWHDKRLIYSYIAEVWRADYASEPDPLDQMVKDGKLKRVAARFIRAGMDTYHALWHLIVYAYPKLKNLMGNDEIFPFQSDFELLKQITLELEKNNLFEYTLPYSRFSPRSIEAKLINLKNLAEGTQLKPNKIKELERLIKDSRIHKLKWQLVLLNYAEQNRKKDSKLDIYYRAYNEASLKIIIALIPILHHYFVEEWFRGIRVVKSSRGKQLNEKPEFGIKHDLKC